MKSLHENSSRDASPQPDSPPAWPNSDGSVAQCPAPENNTATRQPAEARTFSIVEMLVLIGGFSVAGGTLSRGGWGAEPIAFGLSLYLATGLSLCGPIIVTWRERLGRRRLVWGLGESLWFALGILVQNAVITAWIADWVRIDFAAVSSLALAFLLPAIYLTGNPRIQASRAPASWSNIVGLTAVALWGLTLAVAIFSSV